MATRVGNVVGKVSELFNEKLVQVSLISAVLFWIVANPQVFGFVENTLQKLGSTVGFNLRLQGQGLLIFHSLVFAVLMGLSVRYVFEPLLKKSLVNSNQ